MGWSIDVHDLTAKIYSATTNINKIHNIQGVSTINQSIFYEMPMPESVTISVTKLSMLLDWCSIFSLLF